MNEDHVLKESQVNEALISSLLRCDESLRSGKMAVTEIVSTDLEFLQNLELGQAALLELEAAIPRRPKAMPSWAPNQIGRFEIRSVLGSGGFAVVYLAFDPRLNRSIALKIPRPHVLTERDHQRRFVNEARASAKLDHPNIVPVYEAGEDGDLPYIACAWCDGPTLGKWLTTQATRIQPALAARIVKLLTDAVQYSHEQGILHRDIKPGNVLLFPQQGSIDSEFHFVPRLSDFGLAKLLESEHLDSVTSQLIGTPPYMAPELIVGGASNAAATSDVYALGAVLYCLLIGRPPFESASTVETLRQIVERDAVAPHVINPGIGRDLSLICMKCLEKTPLRRYATAAELGQDLDRYLSGKPVTARKTPILVHIQKWYRQRPLVATLLAVSASLAMVLLVLAVLYTASLQDFQKQLQVRNDQLKEQVTELDSAISIANKNKAESESHRRAAEELVFAGDLKLADSLRRAGDIRGAIRILDEYDSPGSSAGKINGHESFAWRYIKSLTSMPGTTLPDTGQVVWDMQLSPDGRKIAMCGDKGIIRILDVKNGYQTIVEDKIATTELNAVTWCDSEPILAVSGDDGLIRICDVVTLKCLRKLDAIPDKHAYRLAFVPGTTRLLVSGQSKDVQLWEATTGQLLQTVETPHERIIENLAISSDGKQFATGGDEGIVCMWSTDSLSVLWQHRITRGKVLGPVTLVRFTPNEKYIAVCGMKNSVYVFDSGTGEQICEWSGLIRLQALAASNNQIFCGDSEGLLRVLSLDEVRRELRPDTQWLGHDAKVSSIIISSMKGDYSETAGFLSTDRSGKLLLWPGQSPVLLPDFAGNQDEAYSTLWGLCWKNNTTLLRRGQRSVDRLDTTTRKVEQVFSSPAPVTCCQYAASAACMVIGNDRGELRVIPDDQSELPSIRVFENVTIGELSVDSAATRAVVRGLNNEVAVVNLHDNQVLERFADRESSAVSPDGRWIVSGRPETQDIEIYDGKTLQLIQRLSAVDLAFSESTFSPDSRLFLSTGRDRTIRVWDCSNWTLLHRISSGSRELGAIALHPDGRILAAGDDENRVKLWDIRSGRELAIVGEFSRPLYGLSFSPNGESLGLCFDNLDVKVIHVPK